MSRNPLEFSLSSRMIKPNRRLDQDWLVLFLIISLVSFGLMMIYSASGSVEMVLRQGIFAVIGIVFMIYLSFSDYQRLLPIYLNVFWIGIFFLLVVLVILLMQLLEDGLIWEFLVFSLLSSCVVF